MRKPAAVAVVVLALGLGLTSPASAATAEASCQGLALSSLAGEPGAVANERQDAFSEAAELGITAGALTSTFARSHAGTLDACFE